MSSRRSGGTPALSDADTRLLRRFEWLLALIVVVLVAAHGRDYAWPFNVWPMYARSFPPPPRQVSEMELHLVSRDGEVVRLLPPNVFTHVEIELGRRVVAGAFGEQPNRDRYRAVLLRRLGPLLRERDVVQIQGWRLSWTTEPAAVPPFDLARPDEAKLLGRIRLPSAAASLGSG